MAQEMSEEEMRKKLENMSPEEIAELQKKQCIFCHIVSGKVASKKIYEDPKVLAILDINPANPGHILLLPKQHYDIMPRLPEEDIKYIFMIAKQISNAALKALDVRGTNIIVANGVAAGQRAPHFMIHIIPRKEGDNLKFTLPSTNRPEAELDQIAQALREKMKKTADFKPPEPTAEEILQKSKPKVVEAEFKEATSDEKIKVETKTFPEHKKETIAQEVKKDDMVKRLEEVKVGKKAKRIRSPAEEAKEQEWKEQKKEKEEKNEKKEEIDLDAIARVLNGR